jgi:hypothetical protein
MEILTIQAIWGSQTVKTLTFTLVPGHARTPAVPPKSAQMVRTVKIVI